MIENFDIYFLLALALVLFVIIVIYFIYSRKRLKRIVSDDVFRDFFKSLLSGLISGIIVSGAFYASYIAEKEGYGLKSLLSYVVILESFILVVMFLVYVYMSFECRKK